MICIKAATGTGWADGAMQPAPPDPALSDIVVAPLAPDQIRPAWPLVRVGNPGLSLAQWLRFARRTIRPAGSGKPRPHGVMVARRRGRPLLCGLVCYQRVRDIACGEVLNAGHYIALDIIDPAPVLDALVGAVEALAVELGCSAVRSMVCDNQVALSATLRTGGHAPLAALMTKPVGNPRVGG